jgi:hypothetical protein
MNTTSILILNGIVAAGLLTLLALVMVMGHRIAGSKAARVARWSQPLELQTVQAKPVRPELDRAA